MLEVLILFNLKINNLIRKFNKIINEKIFSIHLITFSAHDDNVLLVNNREAVGNTLKNEPEKLLINNNIYKRVQSSQDQEYKKLNSDDQDVHQKQLISIGHTDIYCEKMKVRIPDPTFDDNFLNEKSHNSVRVNSINHKHKEEDPFDHNGGRSVYENNKEQEEDFKNKTSSDRKEFLEHNNMDNDRENLINMDENENNIIKNDEDIIDNNIDGEMKIGETPEGQDEEQDNAEREGITPEGDQENGLNNGEGGENNEDNGNIENNAEENNEGNNNEEGEANNEENVEVPKNEEENQENANGNIEEANAENAEANAEVVAEAQAHAEILDENVENPVEGEANAEEVVEKPAEDLQVENPENPPEENPENPPAENAENMEESPQE